MGDENNNVKVVKVVRTVNTGIRQVPINAQDAVNMAREQAQMQQNAVMQQNVQIQQSPQVVNTNNVGGSGIVMTPINLNPEDGMMDNGGLPTPMPMTGNNPGEYTEEDVNMVNDVNDLVKVVDVKYSKKTVLIMVAVIAALILIFLIFELPMLMEL